MIRASVVIPTYNRRDSLRRVLLCLSQQSLPAGELEVVVADTGSTDGTREMVEGFAAGFALRYLYVEKKHLFEVPTAKNAAFPLTSGEVVIYLDSDILVPRHFVAEHLACHRIAPRLCVCGGYVHLLPQEIPDELIARGLDGSRLEGETAPYQAGMLDFAGNLAACRYSWSYCYGGNFSVRREDLEAVGPWDESWAHGMMAHERDLAYRLHLDGVRFVFSRPAAGFHDWGATPMAYQKDRSDRVQQGLRHIQEKFPGEEIASYIRFKERYEESLRAFHDRAARRSFPVRPAEIEEWIGRFLRAPRPRLSLAVAFDGTEALASVVSDLAAQDCDPELFELLAFDRRMPAGVGIPRPDGAADLWVQLSDVPFSLRYFPAAAPPPLVTLRGQLEALRGNGDPALVERALAAWRKAARGPEELLAHPARQTLFLGRTNWFLDFFYNHSFAGRCRGELFHILEPGAKLASSYVSERLAEIEEPSRRLAAVAV